MMSINEFNDIVRNFCVGQKVEVFFKPVYVERERKKVKKQGIIKGIYRQYIAVQFDKYIETFMYTDILAGRVQIKCCRRDIA